VTTLGRAGKAHAEVAALRAETVRKVIPLLTAQAGTHGFPRARE
jgi:hypothetical protein